MSQSVSQYIHRGSTQGQGQSILPCGVTRVLYVYMCEVLVLTGAKAFIKLRIPIRTHPTANH